MKFDKPFLVIALASSLVMSTACSDDGDDGDGGVPDAAVLIDAPVGDGTCRMGGDCPPGESCVGPNDVFCGIAPQEGCFDDGECLGGDVCHVISDNCSADGFGSMCGPTCPQGDACGNNLVCDADGACRPLPCDDPAVECRPSEVCDPASIDPAGPVHGIDHGCANVACADDGPCQGATVCVNGYCQDGPGACSLPAP